MISFEHIKKYCENSRESLLNTKGHFYGNKSYNCSKLAVIRMVNYLRICTIINFLFDSFNAFL